MNQWSGRLIAFGLLASGAILLTGCSGSTEPEASTQGDPTPTPSSVEETTEESDSPDEVIAEAPTDAEPTSAVTDQQRTFFVQNSSVSLGYPVETSSVLSDVTGEIPIDQYAVTWSFDSGADEDGALVPYRRYNLNPNVDFRDTPPSEGDYRWLCVERSDGYEQRCTGLPDGFPMSLDGQYELYTQEFGPGGMDEPVSGTKEVLGTFVYTAPKYEEPLAPALCELTGGTAVLNGDNYVITVDHEGECSSTQTWLGNVQVVNDQSGLPVNYFTPPNVSEVTHDEMQTVLNVPREGVTGWLEFINLSPDDINAFQVMSGSNETGYRPSTVRIPVQK